MSETYRVTAGGKFHGDFTSLQQAINLRDNLHLDGFRDAAVEVIEEVVEEGICKECGNQELCLLLKTCQIDGRLV
jgi:hypothetical protein